MNYKQAIQNSFSVGDNSIVDTKYQTSFKYYVFDEEVWIVFRPTCTKLNWIMNFIFPLKKIPYGNSDSPIRMHWGFLKGYKNYLRGELHRIVQENIGKKFVFTGHSLGGALARIGGLDISWNYGIMVEIRSYAAPRIGNKAFEESYNRRIEGKHFVTENDIVPQVPFLWMGYGEYEKIELEGKGGWFIDHYPETYFQNTEASIWQ